MFTNVSCPCPVTLELFVRLRDTFVEDVAVLYLEDPSRYSWLLELPPLKYAVR
jgi:hypothetical protein